MTNESSIILLLQYENNNNNNDSNTNNEQMTIRLLQTTMTNITVSLYHSLVNEPNQMIDDRDIVNVLAPLNQTTMINMTTITELNKNNNKLIYDFDPNAFYGEIFHRLNYEYRNIHGYLSLVVCVFGIIANVLNIIVLTRKNMESPTNTILTGMAVSDLLVIASFLPYVIHNYIRTEVPEEQMYNYGWAVFTLFHAHNTVLFHTISIWLTVLLAVWRFITVRTPLRTRSMLTIGRARLYILLVYLIVPVFCIPVFITFTIHPIPAMNPQKNISIYTVDIVKLEGKNHELLEKITFWVFSVFMKLIPCGLLTCITLALIRILIEARKRKEPTVELKQSNQINNDNDKTKIYQSDSEKEKNLNCDLKINDNNDDNDLSKSSTTNCQQKKQNNSNLSNCSRINPQNNSSCNTNTQQQQQIPTPHPPSLHATSSSSGNSERTTRMLIAVLIMFLVCEFPSGILALLSGILGKSFFKNVYGNFGDLMDMLALINSAVNFVLYCLMSQQFRKTFSQLFCIRWTVESENGVGHHHHNHTRNSCIGSPSTMLIHQPSQSNRIQTNRQHRTSLQAQQQQQQKQSDQNESISMTTKNEIITTTTTRTIVDPSNHHHHLNDSSIIGNSNNNGSSSLNSTTATTTTTV
ncbi:sex peptide receptor-like [Dermatophagoides farinae]|uniref:Sex peptide receptor-like n=1 Tax=Dermatophagoides farinae TaxID=6954 RepID=A0A9D4SD15_DERFA|nr:sex peptide receptor-like [Dermatophagoides farinae]